MCSHTPLECPLGISMVYHMIYTPQRHHLEGLQIGLRYIQIPEIWLFWTYPWNPRYHEIDPFQTSEIPPVSSYSHHYIQIWTYLGPHLGTPRGPIIASSYSVVPYVPPYSRVCPSGIPYMGIHRYTIYRDHLRWSPGGSPEPSRY